MRVAVAFLFSFFIEFCRLVSNLELNQCRHLTSCEQCAGFVDNEISCRWCLESTECVPSKYQCHPWKTVIHEINCPLPKLPTTYSDTFLRTEIAAYIQAANRVSEYSPVGAPMSCLMKLPSNVAVLYELDVPTSLEGRTIGVLIGVNHDLQHVFIGFRSTNDPVQFVSQFYVFMMGWMENFPLGGRMVAIYSIMYKNILDFGFDSCLEKAIERFPTYSLLVTGHSLGGAMATVFSLHVAMKYQNKQTRLYSLSAPRSGDETFVKLLRKHVYEEFRVVRDGDFVPDSPFRVSQTIETAHHNSFEIFYGSHMAVDNYVICDQPETEYCLKGSWWKKPVAHMYLFDQNFYNYHLGYCE
uniref:Lipase_3 domain-containing protein n=1 Tax=Caenorhabditis tropicalis TaxID=1561998 RepID=A0A1I7UUC4_9PELO